MPKLLQKACTAALLCLALSGCAMGRGVAPVESITADNPTSGAAVKIAAVEDARVFAIDPRDPSTPSLRDDAISDTSITSRAFARKRGGFGQAMGDVVLPEGQTVAKLVGDAVATGFRRAGYRVLGPNDAGYDKATPVSAQIKQFWSWFTPGMFSVTVSHRSEVRLAAPGTPLAVETTFFGSAETSGMAATESDFQTVSRQGLETIAAKITEAQRKAP